MTVASARHQGIEPSILIDFDCTDGAHHFGYMRQASRLLVVGERVIAHDLFGLECDAEVRGIEDDLLAYGGGPSSVWDSSTLGDSDSASRRR